MNKIKYILIGLIFFCRFSYGQEMEVVMDLSGKWSFSIGDNLEWANEKFDHSQWQKIHVPGSWESQGYYGYDGTAWYRESFTLNFELNNQNLYLELGYIDDVDEVYINGEKIGFTGSFPPNYKTAYNARRIYSIPKNVLKPNSKNVIAVRVFDEQLEGGILRGNIKLLKERNPLLLDMDLQGSWKFKTGDNKTWSNLNDYSDWSEILVPGTWENQGFFNYDGFAWYVIQFTLANNLTNENLIMVLGKIDDLDQLYINGEFVSSTGQFEENNHRINVSGEYRELRGYYLPLNTLKSNGINTIAVRVYDARGNGGIYQGPVGLITQEKYIQYWRNRKERK